MKNYIFYTLALLGTALVSCESQKSESCDDPVSFVSDAPFTLCQGNTAYWNEDNEFSIVFKEVTDDSRCPPNANCIWAGSARIALRFNNFDQAFTDTLSIGDPNHPFEVEFAGRTIRLLSVSPDPQLGTIPQCDYKATIMVHE